ncbi:MAG: hypothetical protein ACK5XT_09855 [Gemmatimonas sp.]|jgi:hypothetical protein|uniref:hypothetical protein n=1 Tax=Gemmatimonas sp. TaxID=1962908 RepID=UPI00391F2F08|nr:hypothetical protein [Gemmatimonadota bacterium]
MTAPLAMAWLVVAHLAAGTLMVEQTVGPLPAADTATRQPGQPPTGRREQTQFDATRFDSVTANTLRGLFEDAVEMGLPTRPLINRALEGAARRMSSERIIRVVREHAAALSSAKAVLGPGSSEAELDAAAMALRSGIDEPSLTAVRRSRPAGSAVTALVVLTDLVRRGVPRPEAREAVTSLASLPRSDDALLGLQSTVAKNALRGPGMALDALNRYVRGTASGTVTPSTPATTDRKPVRPPDP